MTYVMDRWSHSLGSDLAFNFPSAEPKAATSCPQSRLARRASLQSLDWSRPRWLVLGLTEPPCPLCLPAAHCAWESLPLGGTELRLADLGLLSTPLQELPPVSGRLEGTEGRGTVHVPERTGSGIFHPPLILSCAGTRTSQWVTGHAGRLGFLVTFHKN